MTRLRRKPGAPALERFFDRVDKRANGCWLWTVSLDAGGYGRFSPVSGGSVRAHIWAYTTFVGLVPDGLQLDHLCHGADPDCPGGVCDHRRCVNPAHLEPVTPLVNVKRGRGNVIKTHCPQGHAYSDPTSFVYRGRRFCRACRTTRLERMRPDQHGTRSGYSYGCRCDACRQACRDDSTRRRNAARAAREAAA